MRANILFSHGSRDPAWRAATNAVAQRMRDLEPAVNVRCAFLELMQPDLAEAVSESVKLGATQIVVTPMFLGVGKHAREDLPRLLETLRARYPTVMFQLKAAVGEDPTVVNVLARVALS